MHLNKKLDLSIYISMQKLISKALLFIFHNYYKCLVKNTQNIFSCNNMYKIVL